MPRNTVSIRMRLTLSVFLLVVAVLSGYLLFYYYDLRGTLQSELTTVAESTASRLSRQLAAPLWSINEQQISATVDSEMAQSELEAVEIVDPVDKRVLFERNRSVVRTGSAHAQPDAIVARQTIVTEAGEPIGIAVVRVSLLFMQTTLRTALTQRGIELLLLGGILVFAYLMMAQFLLLMPLKRAANAIRSTPVSGLGDLIKMNRNSELGELLHAVDDLQQRLRLAYSEKGK